MKSCSVSLLQLKLIIGFNRAKRLLSQLVLAKIIEEYNPEMKLFKVLFLDLKALEHHLKYVLPYSNEEKNETANSIDGHCSIIKDVVHKGNSTNSTDIK